MKSENLGLIINQNDLESNICDINQNQDDEKSILFPYRTITPSKTDLNNFEGKLNSEIVQLFEKNSCKKIRK